jgi:hypothetical protein
LDIKRRKLWEISEKYIRREEKKIQFNLMEVRKMEPRVEDYLDSTCVASTAGGMLPA